MPHSIPRFPSASLQLVVKSSPPSVIFLPVNVPMVSFIIPTLNSGRYITACLRSIRMQQYDPTRYEILIADGGSRDATVQIANEFQATLIDARGLLAEASKGLALRQARGDFIAMVDTDNEITSPLWLQRITQSLAAHPDALGFESYYIKRPGSPLLNRYLTALLQISDPIAKTMAGPLKPIAPPADGLELYRLPSDGSHPTGANGFVFHRRLLDLAPRGVPFHEAAFFPGLIQSGHVILLKRQDCSIYHDYADGWMHYMRKRRRMVINYLLRRQEVPVTWDSKRSRWALPLAFLYHSTVIGPLLEYTYRAARDRDLDWLIGPAVSLWSCIGVGLGYLDYSRQHDTAARKRLSMKLNTGAEALDAPGDNKQ
jgi:glycosyltransferase involved in cell wall biosynthesis